MKPEEILKKHFDCEDDLQLAITLNPDLKIIIAAMEEYAIEENKYHFAREIIFNLRSCHAISEAVYLHWIDKLINDEQSESILLPDRG